MSAMDDLTPQELEVVESLLIMGRDTNFTLNPIGQLHTTVNRPFSAPLANSTRTQGLFNPTMGHPSTGRANMEPMPPRNPAVLTGQQALQAFLIRAQLLAGIQRENLISIPPRVAATTGTPAVVRITNNGVSVPQIPPATFNGEFRPPPGMSGFLSGPINLLRDAAAVTASPTCGIMNPPANAAPAAASATPFNGPMDMPTDDITVTPAAYPISEPMGPLPNYVSTATATTSPINSPLVSFRNASTAVGSPIDVPVNPLLSSTPDTEIPVNGPINPPTNAATAITPASEILIDSLRARTVEQNLFPANSARGRHNASNTRATGPRTPQRVNRRSSTRARPGPSRTNISRGRAINRNRVIKRERDDDRVIKREDRSITPSPPPYARGPFVALLDRATGRDIQRLFTPPLQSRLVPSIDLPHNGFDLLQAVAQHLELATILTQYLGVRDMTIMISVSVPFHDFVFSNLTEIIRRQTISKCPLAARLYPFRCYDHLCILRSRTVMTNNDITNGANNDQTDQTNQTDQSNNITTMVIDRAPTLPYLSMLFYRDLVINHCMRILKAENHALPPITETAIKKIWFLMDIPDNRRREWTIQNRNLWTNVDLLFACLFLVRLDLYIKSRFSRTIVPANVNIGHLIMAQPTMTFFWGFLRGIELSSHTDIMKAFVKWKYEPLEGHEDLPVFGIQGDELGALQWEDYGRRGRRQTKLLRPDEIVLGEVVRRRLDMSKLYQDLFLWTRFARNQRCERPKISWDAEMKIMIEGSGVSWLDAVQLD